MTTAGWIFMLSSITFVVLLCAYCFARVIRKPAAADHMHSPVDIETGDEDT
jgi:hypothetical protein